MIEAPEGTCRKYDRSSPPIQLIYPIGIDKRMIRLKLNVNRFAVICGIVSRDMANTMPIIRRQDTMVNATDIIRIYSNKVTGKRCDFANSRSNAIATIVRINNVKNSIRAMFSAVRR